MREAEAFGRAAGMLPAGREPGAGSAGAVRALSTARWLEGRRRWSEEEMAWRRLLESGDERSSVRQADPLLPQTAKVSASGREPVDSWEQRAACRKLKPNLVKMGIVGKCILHSEMN